MFVRFSQSLSVSPTLPPKIVTTALPRLHSPTSESHVVVCEVAMDSGSAHERHSHTPKGEKLNECENLQRCCLCTPGSTCLRPNNRQQPNVICAVCELMTLSSMSTVGLSPFRRAVHPRITAGPQCAPGLVRNGVRDWWFFHIKSLRSRTLGCYCNCGLFLAHDKLAGQLCIVQLS